MNITVRGISTDFYNRTSRLYAIERTVDRSEGNYLLMEITYKVTVRFNKDGIITRSWIKPIRTFSSRNIRTFYLYADEKQVPFQTIYSTESDYAFGGKNVFDLVM